MTTKERALKNILIAVATPLLALAQPFPASAQSAQIAQIAPPSCQFILGFKTLHDMDPADIGDCIDNQAFAANGDAQQHTTKGLMVWRKSDNWTGFTNGYQTWINGPSGLVSRLNTQRFSWEPDFGAPGLTPASSCQSVASGQGSSRTFQRPPAPCQ